METPFDRPPINVSAALVEGSVPAWRKDYLATLVATTEEKGRPTMIERVVVGVDGTADSLAAASTHAPAKA